jgi:hypothetical protein
MLLVDGEPVLSTSAAAASRTVRALPAFDELVCVRFRLSDPTAPGLSLAGGRRGGARGGARGAPRAPRRGRPAQGHIGDADLRGAGGGAEARLRLPAGVRHGGSGSRRGACRD